jgi:hypothetical protein
VARVRVVGAGLREPFGVGGRQGDPGGKGFDQGGPAVHLLIEDDDVVRVGDGDGGDRGNEDVAAEGCDALDVGPVDGESADGAVSEVGRAPDLGGVGLDFGAEEGDAKLHGLRGAGWDLHWGAAYHLALTVWQQ